MNYYEMVTILDPNIEDSSAEETIGKIRNIITGQSGEILKAENWGRRKLAYELNKHQKGNYFLLFFKTPSSTILEIEKTCKVLDQVIKFMIVKLQKKKQIEAVLQSVAEKQAKPEAEKAAGQEKSEDTAAQPTE